MSNINVVFLQGKTVSEYLVLSLLCIISTRPQVSVLLCGVGGGGGRTILSVLLSGYFYVNE